MEEYSIDLDDIVVEELKKKGIDQDIIPRFIKDMMNSYSDNPSISLFQANDHLRLLGWDDITLDYHTFQLILSYIEKERSGITSNH
jgi:hypothetical protein